MRLTTIKCSVIGCDEEYTEAAPGAGFPNWGAIHGVHNPETGEDFADLCPTHRAMIVQQYLVEKEN